MRIVIADGYLDIKIAFTPEFKKISDSLAAAISLIFETRFVNSYHAVKRFLIISSTAFSLLET